MTAADFKDFVCVFRSFPAFREWVKDKKLSPKEIGILTEFPPKNPPKSLLKWIEKHRPGHSEGAQILDLAGELILMGQTTDGLLSKETKAVKLIQALKKRRMTVSAGRDEEKAKTVARMGWPPSIKARWVRENDRGALMIQFKSFSLRDFRQKIQKLETALQELEQGSNKLWQR